MFLVNGNWTRWSPWQPCSVTCGPGFQERSRFCSAPEPAYGGLPCSGADSDRRICNQADCPSECRLASNTLITGSVLGPLIIVVSYMYC